MPPGLSLCHAASSCATALSRLVRRKRVGHSRQQSTSRERLLEHGTADIHQRTVRRQVARVAGDVQHPELRPGTPQVVDHLVTASLDVIEAAGAESRARLVATILQDCDAIEAGVRIALAIAFASQGLSAAETKVIERIASAGGLSSARLAELTAEIRKVADPDPISVRLSIAPSSRP